MHVPSLLLVLALFLTVVYGIGGPSCPRGSRENGICSTLVRLRFTNTPFNISVDDGGPGFPFLRSNDLQGRTACLPEINKDGSCSSPTGNTFQGIHTPFTLGVKRANTLPPYHETETLGQIVGQNYGTCIGHAGIGGAGGSGQWTCDSGFTFYDDRFFANCDTLSPTNRTVYNVNGCPICNHPDVTCNNHGTGMVLGRIAAKVWYPRYAPQSLPLVYVEEFPIAGGTGIFREIAAAGGYGKLILDRSYLPITYEIHWSSDS